MNEIFTRVFDIVITGGGLSGVCAAIAAARCGACVALIQNRPVLGGNSSSEIRVWTTGAIGESTSSSVRFGLETGIIGELQMENLRKNPEGNPYIWDTIVLDAVLREKNLALFLNTEAYQVVMKDMRIVAIHGRQAGSELTFRFEAKVFIDCSGDGIIGALAGADWMMGRESVEAYGEPHAQVCPDDRTLGTTLFYYVKDTGKLVRYFAPDFAYSLEYIEKLLTRTGKTIKPECSGCCLWWFEFGGVLNTIAENETIRDELQRLMYGIWNYIKNSGRYKAETLTLEWVGFVPGKRESRRFFGPHVLCEKDIAKLVKFEDGVCFGGSPIDPHPPEGIYSSEPSNINLLLEGIYEIPLSCLYSRNISNLLFAGRLVSASHVAFCSLRVMKTCAVIGQAAGTAAALSVKENLLPIEFNKIHLRMLAQTLLREDCWIPGRYNEDSADIARYSTIKASGFRTASLAPDGEIQPLDREVWFFLPPPEREGRIILWCIAKKRTVLHISVFTTEFPWNYRSLSHVKEYDFELSSGEQKINLTLSRETTCGGNVCIYLKTNEHAAIRLSQERCTGFFAAYDNMLGHQLRYPAFETDAYPRVYAPEHITDGFSRPWGAPSLWASPPLSEQPYLCLILSHPAKLRRIILFCNSDLLRGLINIQIPDLQHMGWDRMPPELLRDADLYAKNISGEEHLVAQIRNNYHRRIVCDFDELDVVSIRFVPLSTWGASHVEIFEIRLYDEEAISIDFPFCQSFSESVTQKEIVP